MSQIKYETVMGKDKREWVIKRTYVTKGGRTFEQPGQVVLYRYDSKAPVSGNAPAPGDKFMLCGLWTDEDEARKAFPQAFGVI